MNSMTFFQPFRRGRHIRHIFSRQCSTATFKCSPTKVHLCEHPPSEIEITKSEMMHYFREMSRIRRMELASDMLYKQRLIRGFCHLYDGQEAVAMGVDAGTRPDDHLITAYRCHAQQLLRGDTMKSIIAEMLGRKGGAAKGKGGSMHLYLPEKRFHGGNGIVGAQVPIGAGLAFAAKYLGEESLAIAMYGDGAANQGQLGLDVRNSPYKDIVSAATEVTEAVRSAIPIENVISSDLDFLYGTIVTDGLDQFCSEPTANLCVFADAEVDRSPCGSGVSARVAVQWAKRQISKKKNKNCVRKFVNARTGSVFEGRVASVDKEIGYDRVVVEVSGKAFYTG
eukprot:922786_1